MKKYFKYLMLALPMMLCMAACGSDNDDNGNEITPQEDKDVVIINADGTTSNGSQFSETGEPDIFALDGILYKVDDDHIKVWEGTRNMPNNPVIPGKIKYKGTTYKVTVVGDNCFFNSENLTGITLPEGLEKIESEAFIYCKKLKSVVIPSTVKSIGDNVFYECRELASVKLPEGLEKIPQQMCYNCVSLASINIPEGVTTIGKYAFQGCEKLVNLSLPYGLNTIENFAFEHCNGLETISFPSTLVFIGEKAFHDCPKLREIRLPEGVKEVGTMAFYPCSSAEVISIPSTMIHFGSAAFSGCKNIKDLYIYLKSFNTELEGSFTADELKNTTVHFPPELLMAMTRTFWSKCNLQPDL